MSVIKNNKNYGTRVKIEQFEPYKPAERTYFYIDNITNEENTITIKTSTDFHMPVTVYKSTDKVNWELMGTTEEGRISAISATIPAYGRLYLKGNNTHWGQEEAHFTYFTSTNLVTIGGYLSSLAIGDNYETNETNVPWSRTFYNWSNLLDAKDLILPNGNNWFYGMFEQSNIKTAPLTVPTVGSGCQRMFAGCKRLTQAPALPATTLADNCYETMFQGCTSLTTAPALPATTLTYDCYHEMFWGCTSLTTAPALPATTLADYCYATMFVDCTSLTQAPVLPATTLTDTCYNSMFYGCTNLNSVTTYAQDISAGGCLDNWLDSVSSTGDFYNLGGASYESGSSGIPEGWTEHTSL